MISRSLLRLVRLLLLAVAVGAAPLVHGDDVVVPNPNLKADGIPPIPATLAKAVALYTEFRPRALASWHPVKRELIVATRATNTAQLFDVKSPLGPLRQITDYTEPVRYGMWWPAKPDVLVFARDAGGNEQRQVYRVDPGAKEPILLTDAGADQQPAAINRARDRLLVTVTDVDKTSGPRENPMLDLVLIDPLEPSKARKIATLPGTGWGDFSFSFDDRRLAMIEFKSITESYVWVMDIATGERKRVLPLAGGDAGKQIASGEINFARDGKGLFLTTDRDGEFRRASFLDLESGGSSRSGRRTGTWRICRSLRMDGPLRLSPTRRVSACCAYTTRIRDASCRSRTCQSAR
jgi:Tol biopolymer transport system component